MIYIQETIISILKVKTLFQKIQDATVQHPNETGGDNCPQRDQDRPRRAENHLGQSRRPHAEKGGYSPEDGFADQIDQEPHEEEGKAPDAVTSPGAGSRAQRPPSHCLIGCHFPFSARSAFHARYFSRSDWASLTARPNTTASSSNPMTGMKSKIRSRGEST